MKEIILRKKIKNFIKEAFEQSDNNDINVFDAEKAKEVVLAFINNQIDKGSVKVEESEEMEVSDMIDANDYLIRGHAYKKENPIVFFKYKGEEYSFPLEIEKEYTYETESGDWNTPSYESSDLVDLKLTNSEIEIGNSEGEIFKVTKSDLGKETFKKFEKTLMGFIK